MKNHIKSLFNFLGLDVRLTRNMRKPVLNSWEVQQAAMWKSFLSHLDIRTIIDVGANEGQFARQIHLQCPNAFIVSVEPLESCHTVLEGVLAKFPQHKVVKAAAGSKNGELFINVSDFSPCSSVLPPTDIIGEDYPSAAVVTPAKIRVVRLDDELPIDDMEGDLLIKFDVQGYEIEAMKGAEELLRKARVVICEVCFFRQLYAGQPLFHETYAALHRRGFNFMGTVDQSRRKSDGRIVEADAVFERIKAS